MTYAEAIESLYSLRLFGAKLGLENPRRLAALAGRPQARLRLIHVAGTNGKGSVCALVESVYRAAGYRVGLFTSPHLVSFRERLQINRVPIDEAGVVELVDEMAPLLAEFGESRPTFFEVVTVMALRYFAFRQCDVVVWETGLGGRLDATNIVEPIASVITNIHHDHEKWLGSSLREIAYEKAGIIKPGIPALTAATQPEALAEIRKVADTQGAPLAVITEPGDGPNLGRPLNLRLMGRHQEVNAALAAATVHRLQPILPVDRKEVLCAGLEQAEWPGRLQLVRRGDQTLILDGAHNLNSIQALRETLETNFPKSAPAFVMGFLKDKDWRCMCQAIAPIAGALYLAPVHSERALAMSELQGAAKKIDPRLRVGCYSSLAAALNASADEPFRVICGSIHFIGEAMAQLGITCAPDRNERNLNDWGAATTATHGP